MNDGIQALIDKESQKEVQQTTANHLKNIMDKLKYTLEQAMDVLGIPQADRATYAALVQQGL